DFPFALPSAVAGKQAAEREARNRRGQREREIDERVDEPLAPKFVTHQYPGKQRPENRIYQRGKQGGPERQLVSRQRPGIRCQPPEIMPGKLKGFEEKRSDGNEHERAEVKQRVAHRQPKAGQRVEFFFGHASAEARRKSYLKLLHQ